MSLGYAVKLSHRDNVGSVGMCEIFDPPHVLQEKVKELAVMIQKSKHLVAFTGAGISTSCGIPDFRGPKGVWTLQHEGKDLPEMSLPFHRAMPSLTHMALVALEKAGILKFVVSQNIDSLHLRSGIPRAKLAELHGNSFRELCPSCGKEYLRDFEVETIGMKETSRRCSDLNCHAKLRDTVLDWDDELPPKEMNPAEQHCKMADVVICLGTSLQIKPACDLPLKATRAGGKLVIVNLQPTPKDKNASLVIHGKVDKVIAGVLDFLNLEIPPYVRIELVQLSLTYTTKSFFLNPRFQYQEGFEYNDSIRSGVTKVIERLAPNVTFAIEATREIAQFRGKIGRFGDLTAQTAVGIMNPGKKNMSWILRIASVQGQRTPLPFLKSVEVIFPDRSDLKNTLLAKQPFFLIRETLKTRPFKMTLKLNLNDGCACGCPCPTIEWPVDFQAPVRTFNHKKDVVFHNLREEAVCNSCSGQFAAIERMTLSDPKTDIRVFAFVTSLLRHNESVKPLAFEVVPESIDHIMKRHNADIANNRSPKRQKRKTIVKVSDEEPSMDLVLSDFKVPSRTKKAKEKLEARHLDKEIEYERKSESSYVAEPLEKTPLLRESDLSRGSFCDDPDELQDLKDIEVTYQYETAEPLQMEIFGNPSQESRVNYAVTECLEPVGDHTTEKFVSREQPNLETEPLKQPKLEGLSEISKSYRENSPNRDVILHQFEYPDHFLPILRDAAKKMIDTLVARLSSESIVENFGSLSQDIRAICHIIKSCPEEIQKLEEILQILVDKELEIATFSSELCSLEEKVKFLEEELLRAKETKAACLQRSTESKSSVKDIREKLIENVRRIVD